MSKSFHRRSCFFSSHYHRSDICLHTVNYMLVHGAPVEAAAAFKEHAVYILRSQSQHKFTQIYHSVPASGDNDAAAFLCKWSGRLTATVSGLDWFDFTAANKGMGIRLLMEKMKVSKEEAAAFGDNFNDETMLDSVGYPFLMAMADPALRKPGYILCEKEVPVLKRIIKGKGTL